MAVADNLTGNVRFAPLWTVRTPYKQFVSNPNGCKVLRVAVFGGSAAAGWGSPRGFPDVIFYELAKGLSDYKITVTNYAQPGATFHLNQAEILKGVLSAHDVFIVHAGDNEGQLWWDSIGLFRSKEFKSVKELIPIERPQGLIGILERHSRLYSILWRGHCRAALMMMTRGTKPLNQTPSFKEFEAGPVMPEHERRNMIHQFRTHIEEVGQSLGPGQMLIVIGVPTNERYKPIFSYHRGDLSETERTRFRDLYEEGVRHFGDGQYRDALSSLEKACAIDEYPAIVHYLIWRCKTELGEVSSSHHWAMEAVERDGLYVRSFRSLNLAAKEAAASNPRIVYLDLIAAYHNAIEQGLTHDRLFVDLQHPTMLGHAIVGCHVLCELSRVTPALDPRQGAFGLGYCGLSGQNYLDLASRYRAALGVTKHEEVANYAESLRWFVSHARLASYPMEWYAKTEEYLAEYEKRIETPEQEGFALYWRTVLRVRLKQISCEDVTGDLNAALALNAKLVETYEREAASWVDSFKRDLEGLGIELDSKASRFRMKRPTG